MNRDHRQSKQSLNSHVHKLSGYTYVEPLCYNYKYSIFHVLIRCIEPIKSPTN